MRLYTVVFLLAVCITAVSCGQSQSKAVTVVNQEEDEKSVENQEKIFEVSQDSSVLSFRLANGEVVEGMFLAGTGLITTGNNLIDENGQEWMEVISVSEQEESSETIYVRQDEFVGLTLKLVDMQDSDGAFSANSEGFKTIVINGQEMTVETLRFPA